MRGANTIRSNPNSNSIPSINPLEARSILIQRIEGDRVPFEEISCSSISVRGILLYRNF